MCAAQDIRGDRAMHRTPCIVSYSQSSLVLAPIVLACVLALASALRMALVHHVLVSTMQTRSERREKPFTTTDKLY